MKDANINIGDVIQYVINTAGELERFSSKVLKVIDNGDELCEGGVVLEDGYSMSVNEAEYLKLINRQFNKKGWK